MLVTPAPPLAVAGLKPCLHSDPAFSWCVCWKAADRGSHPGVPAIDMGYKDSTLLMVSVCPCSVMLQAFRECDNWWKSAFAVNTFYEFSKSKKWNQDKKNSWNAQVYKSKNYQWVRRCVSKTELWGNRQMDPRACSPLLFRFLLSWYNKSLCVFMTFLS